MIIIKVFLAIIVVAVTLHTGYNFVIAIFGLKKCKKYAHSDINHKFCAVIAARNEQEVIGNLIKSLKAQNYPENLLDVYVILNNCTDNTGNAALKCGANIYECTRDIKTKGDALKEFFESSIIEKYDAFCVFDADNVAHPDFVMHMNDALSSGKRLAQGTKEGKNPTGSWISGSYTIYFWLFNSFVNKARCNICLSPFILGTGFMISSDLLKEIGFNTFTMTEDFELSIQYALRKGKIAYVENALTYDEQPNDFKTSIYQRKRWSTGIMQCSNMYFPSLISKGFKNHSMLCIDMGIYSLFTYVQPLMLLSTLISTVLNFIEHNFSWQAFLLPLYSIVSSFLAITITAIFAIKFTGHRIRDVGIKSIIMFYVFAISWIFISLSAVVKKETVWRPIRHFEN